MSLLLPSANIDVATVNKRQLANLLKVSLPTMTDWIDRYELPVEQRGTNGKEWRFNVANVVDALRKQKDAAQAAGAARDEQLAQLVLPLDLGRQQEAPSGLSIKDQMDAVRLRRLQREEAERLGVLVPAAAITHALTSSLTLWNRLIRTAVRAAAADHNLPDAVTRSIDARIADAQRQFVREAGAMLVPGDDDADVPRLALG